MYSQYKQLSSQKCSQSRLQKFVEDADTNELIQMIVKVLNTSEAIKMLDNTMQGFSEAKMCQDKRFKLVRAVFDALRTAKVTTKHVDNVVGRIVVDFSQYDRTHLVKLIDYFLDRIRTNDDDFMSWKDVIPLLLERLEEDKSINYRGTDVSGQEYKLIVIRSICDIDWDHKILTSLAKMFVEVLVDVKDKGVCQTVIRALTNKLIVIDLSELPPLCHQMLKLVSDQNATLLFATLTKYFTNNYASVSEDNNTQETSDSIISSKVTLKEILEVESTVLYYIYQSALDNATGSLEYMKCLKATVNAPEYILDPFVMSVLLLLSNLHEDQAFQILKLALVRQIQDDENQQNSAWLRRVSSDNDSVMDVINQVIDNSNKDRQLVLKGMVDFGFVLLSIERKAGSTEKHLPWEYGSKIIQKIAKKRHDAAGTIFEILIGKIIQGGTNVIQYTDCLAYMCRKLTMTVVEHQVWITSLLDQLLVIPGTAATQVLRAILPLMRIAVAIRDNLIMILRKALYRKGTKTRQMAVLGFLQLLKNLKLTTLTALSQSASLSSSNVASSSSFFTQATLERPSQRASSNPWQNTSLCREILAILGKCFTHEPEVRTHLYKELYHGIVKNPELTEYVVGMLLEHFYKYYERDDNVLPPVFLEKCSSAQGIDVVLQEPLADLIFVLQKIYLKVASKESARIDKLAVILESLCKRMAHTDLEHLDLNEEVDLLDVAPKAQQKLISIKVMISIYESLIAYKIGSWSQSSENISQSVIALYKGYLRLVEYLRKSSKAKKGKGKKDKDKDGNDTTVRKAGRPAAIKLPFTAMDFDTISKSIILIYDQSNNWSTEEQTSGIRGRIEFHIYTLTTCLQLLQNVKKDDDLQSCLELNRENFFNIAKTLYKHFVCELHNIIEFNVLSVGYGLECFKECCDIICTLSPTDLPEFLKVVCDSDPSEGLALQLQSLISPLKDIFISNLGEEENEELILQKVPLHLIEIISKLVSRITFSEVKAEKLFDWLTKVAQDCEKMDIQVAGAIVQLILMIDERSLDYGETIHDFCLEFCAILGKNDKSEVTSTRKFQMLNEDNVHAAFIAVNKLLSLKLQNVTCLLGRLNSEYTATTSLENDSESNRKKIKDLDAKLCSQFSFIIGKFEILASVKITPGQASDAIFKNLQKVYNFACALTKYFKKKSSPNNPAFQTVKFIPVIQGAGNALKQAITELILHVESSQSGGKSNDANVQRNKILKEVMVIPGVVQALDTFDKEILMLAKKTNIDLIKYTKYDTIRDFRIKPTQLRENLDKMNVSLTITQTNRARNDNDDEEEEEPEDDVSMMSKSDAEDNDDDGSPASKRSRRS